MIAAVALITLTLQTQVATVATGSSRSSAPPAPAARAVRATVAPVIDGRDDDEVWRQAIPITAFRQWQPTEDAPARYATEAKAAFDDKHFYVFVRAHDPHPDSILKLLARRDTWTAADKIWVMIDSYHDRRSGFEFGVNPAGVKIDMAISNDGNEDMAWDAVWDVATTVDSLGWTAEYRIPLSQLRYPPSDSIAFGFAVWRDLQRYSERESWPVFRRSRAGMSSQFGVLEGLTGLSSPRRLEVTPYVSAKTASEQQAAGGYDMASSGTAGADVKYGLTSNLTLDGTVNPDFGQVEADPAVLNLCAFETFFPERRPFFVEGGGLYSFDVNCSAVNCSGEGLFYSRRIGRSPQLDYLYGAANSPTTSRILGAGKLTGHLPGGLNVALLDGVTQHVQGPGGETMEPLTNYFVARLQQDLRKGESGFGGMITAVNRDLDQFSEPYLRRTAYVGAMDFRHRFAGGKYRITGSFDYSYVNGSAAAITATQTSSVHFLQRPDGGVTLDTTRTSLSGDAEELSFGKSAGQHTRWESSLQRHSPGFEINDLGFMQRTDQVSWANWFQVRANKPGKLYRQAMWNNNWWQTWTTQWLATERAYNTNLHAQLPNSWWFHFGGTVGQLGPTYCDFDCTRGGPAVRQDMYIAPWMGFEGDGRMRIVPFLFANYFNGDGGRSYSRNVNGSVDLRLSSRFTPSVGVSLTHRRKDVQNFGTSQFGGTTHYLFAHLDQDEASLSLRMDYTMSPTLTLQVYGQPFVSRGTYSNVRELSATPRAADYDARYQPFADTSVTNNPGGFNFKNFNSNVVLRWEYRPGSALFLVWQQGRTGNLPSEGGQNMGQDMKDIFSLHPGNTLLIKASYWLSW